jgi:hypothetical protein
MANNPAKWSAYTQTATAMFAAADLKNLANAAGKLSGTAINNVAGDQYAYIDLLIDLATAATAGGFVSLWFVLALNGSDYESGADAVFPARPADVIIPVRSTTDDSQRVTVGPVLLPNGLFKPLFQNNTGQTTTNTDSLTQVWFRSFNDNMVTP